MKTSLLLKKIGGSFLIFLAITPVVFAQEFKTPTQNVVTSELPPPIEKETPIEEKTPPQKTMFQDVALGSKHYSAIQFLLDNNIVQGYEDGTFRPQENINRVEALSILFTAFPQTQKNTTSEKIEKVEFKDVKTNQWFYKVVQEGLKNGIINGYPDQKFRPQKDINRAEALKMSILQEHKPFAKIVEKTPYSDVTIDAWFAPYAQVSKNRGLFIETRDNDGQLLPDTTITRGEFAELIYHLIQSSKGSKFGRATFYADSLAGRGTSSGDAYSPGVFTTAHRTLPFGTRLLVKNLANNEEVEVSVNDRGPYATGIELDLSKSAFAAIASTGAGIINIEYTILHDESKF